MAYQISGPVLYNRVNGGIDFQANGSPSASFANPSWADYAVKNFMTWSAGQTLYHTGGVSDIYNQGTSTLAVLPPTTANTVLTLTDIGTGILVPRWENVANLVEGTISTISVTGFNPSANLLLISNNLYDNSTNLFSTWTNLQPFIINESKGDIVDVTGSTTFDIATGNFVPGTNMFVDATLNVGWNAEANSFIGHRAIRFINLATGVEIGSTYQRANPSASDTFTLQLNRQFKVTPTDILAVQVAADAINVNVYLPLTHYDIHTVRILP